MRVIPAIDILGGKCVRLTRGDFSTSRIYNSDPLDAAKEFEDNGIRHLHLVDLDGAKKSMIINYRVLERIASKTSLSIDFGGGMRSDHDLGIAFGSGAQQVTIGSIALSDPEKFLYWLGKYGSGKIILGADCSGRNITFSGWTEKSSADVIEFIAGYSLKGVKYSICTDVEKDGMMQGPSIELYKEILGKAAVSLIASGGVSSVRDIMDLKESGCEGVIVGKAIYEGRITLKEIRDLC